MTKTKYSTAYGNYFFYLKILHDESGREFKIFRPVVSCGKYIVEWRTDAPTEPIDFASVLIQFTSPLADDDTYGILNVYRRGRNYKSAKMTHKYRLVIDKIAAQIRS